MSVRIEPGDCLEVLPRLAAEGVRVDAVVTDPPYHLASIVKRFGKANADAERFAMQKSKTAYMSRGFMGQRWDGGDVAFRPETWVAVAAVMKPGAHLVAFGGTRTYHRLACAIEDAGFEIRDMVAWLYATGFPKSHNLNGAWSGWGTALKPALEPIVLARWPLGEKTVAANVLAHGTGALNIDACRIEVDGGSPSIARRESGRQSGRIGQSEKSPWHVGRDRDLARVRHARERPGEALGRWPANVVHDGSEEVVAGFPQSNGQLAAVGPKHGARDSVNCYGDFGPRPEFMPRGDSGSAARFFYSSKADSSDRLGSKHPTVKPVDLMAWLVKLITPPGGTVLDPFAGTGTTGMACLREGFNAILIEREPEYLADIARRLAHVKGEDAPLFAGAAS